MIVRVVAVVAVVAAAAVPAAAQPPEPACTEGPRWLLVTVLFLHKVTPSNDGADSWETLVSPDDALGSGPRIIDLCSVKTVHTNSPELGNGVIEVASFGSTLIFTIEETVADVCAAVPYCVNVANRAREREAGAPRDP